MELNTTIVRDFLWESYSVYSDREFLRSVQDISHEEKRDRFIDHALDNWLLVRYKRDPGFVLHVMDAVNGNAAVQQRIREIVLLLFGETARISYSDDEPLGPKGSTEIMQKAIREGKNPFEEAALYLKDPAEIDQYNKDRTERERESKMRYLQARLEDAESRVDNDLEIIAIRRLMLDLKTGRYYGHQMGSDDSLFPAAGFTGDILLASQRYLYQNLKFRGRYFATSDQALPEMSLHECIVWMLPFQHTLEKAIFGGSIIDLYIEHKDPAALWKFEVDLTTIAGYEWFLTLSREEKVAVLNENYPFTIREDMLSAIADLGLNISWYCQDKLNQLFYATLYEHAAKIGEYAYSHEKMGDKKYFIASAVATCYREFEDYKAALKWYEIALKLTKKLDLANRIYKELIERKNCSEMRYYMSGSEVFRKEVARIEMDAKRLPAEIRASVIYNLAEACRRTGHHDLEYTYLIEFTVLADLDNPKLGPSLERLDLFNINLDDTDFHGIRDIEARERAEVYERRYVNAVRSFQHADASRWIERLILLRPTSALYQEKAALYRHKGQIGQAIELYQRAVVYGDEPEEDTFRWMSIALLSTWASGEVVPEAIESIRTALHCWGGRHCEEGEQAYDVVLKPVVYETATWHNPTLSTQFIQAFIGEFISIGLPGNPALLIGDAFLGHSMSSEGRQWFQAALETETPSERTQILCMIAESLFMEGDHRAAVEWFKHAQENDPELPDVYIGMARCHTCLMEYDRASADVSKACELDPDNEAYRDLKGEIDMLSAHVIGLPRIGSEEIRSIFRTGDWLLFSVYKGPERGIYDLGPVVIQYGKGVEKLLHESLLLPIRERIRSDNMFCSDPHDGVRKMFWEGYDEKKIPPLPFTLKTVLGNDEKSLALGQWGYLSNDIRKTRANPVTLAFSDMLQERGFSMKTLNELGKLCRDLSLERNGAAHISFYSRDEVMEKRGEMVKIINDIIGIVSRSGGGS
ncbi:MAG: Uncharacterized protein XE11_2313 [Methanomicrobiales archaeon 53_19]|nr:MAG: Uncharacterized protein XD88_0775 [Methanocalculus sp. 52_23]KUL00901.1 MAG: Uncharacterized protein XE11_2313 [Methanomicrobiales archaeon 53_19]